VPLSGSTTSTEPVQVWPSSPPENAAGTLSASAGQAIRRPSAQLPGSANDAAAILSQASKLPEGEQGNKAKSMEELLAEIEPGVRPGDQLIDHGTMQQLHDGAAQVQQHDPPDRSSSHQSTSEAYVSQYQSDYWLQIQSQPAFIRPPETPPTFADNAVGHSIGYEQNIHTGSNGEAINYQSAPASEQTFSTPQLQIVQCRACGSMIEYGSRFCGECGVMAQSLGAALLRTCHLCGAPLDQEARFCGECGSNQFNGASAMPQIPTAVGAPYAPPPNYGAPTQRGWIVKLLKLLER